MNKIKIYSLKNLLITRILFFFVITLIFIFSFSSMFLKNIVNDNFDHQYSNSLSYLISIVESDHNKLLKTLDIEKYHESFKRNIIKKLHQHIKDNDKDIVYFLLDDESYLINLSENSSRLNFLNGFENILKDSPESFEYRYKNKDYWIKTDTFEPWGWKLGVIISHDKKYRLINRYMLIIFIFALFMILLVSIFLYYIINNTISPLYALKKYIIRLSQGELESGFEGELNSIELLELSQAIETMRANMNLYIENIKQESEKRRSAEERFRKLFENLPIAFELYNDKKKRILANKEWYSMWSIKEDEDIGEHRFSGEYESLIDMALKGENISNKEIIVSSKNDEEEKHLKVFTVSLKGESKNEHFVIFLSVDITESKKINEFLVQNEKMMSVGGLAAGMAHEINNPLSGIIGGIQNIQRRLDTNRDKNILKAEELGISLNDLDKYLFENNIYEMIEGIYTSAIRASDIIIDMLEFSRASSDDKIHVDVESIIEDSIKILEKYFEISEYDFHHIKINREYKKVPEIMAIRNELEQVFVNLLKNATRALFDSKKKDKEVDLSLFSRGDFLYIKIKDNGIGMDEKTMKRIFEPFYTKNSKRKGTGLGLSISYFIITKNHSGEIYVNSKKDEWTEFIIKLPVNKI